LSAKEDEQIMNDSHAGTKAKPNPAAPAAHPEKDPKDWVTGDEPMTGPQASYLKTLSQEAGEEFDKELSKAEASKRIEELQAKTGRGK
jgi:Protein of unknown function (DUF3072)